jgi:aspartyl/asparaginyl-tRNA synthetase
VPPRPFPRMTHAEALERLTAEGWEPALPGKVDLDPAGERLLSEIVAREQGHEFVFVTDYPKSIRPFYHHRHGAEGHLTASFDLLWRGVEITTGAQREHRYDVLVAQADELAIKTDGLDFYLDCFRYGCPPHGGFGFGLNRAVMVLLGLSSIREASFLFRGPNRLRP